MLVNIHGTQINVSSIGVDPDAIRKDSPREDEILYAMEIMRNWQLSKTRTTLSYWAKHIVESQVGKYISNGAAIVAASRLNIPMLWDGKSTNVQFAVRNPVQPDELQAMKR